MKSLQTYSQLVQKPLIKAVREDSLDYRTVRERHVQILWLEQKFFTPLETSEEESIEVISPGVWNTEAGPDFLKAHLRIGGVEVKGDVEIHLSQEAWENHRHHKDPRYNQVVLHVCLWLPRQEKTCGKANGESLKTLFLEHRLSLSLSEVIERFDLELYPYERHGQAGHCSQKLFGQVPAKNATELLESAAYWRLKNKFLRLSSSVSEPAQVIPGGIAMALGYKHNAQAFLELFLLLWPFRNLQETELLALGMGVTGFFENSFQKKWNASSYYHHLKTLWAAHSSEINGQVNFKLHQIRPLNHPLRRLVYLSKLLSLHRVEDLHGSCLRSWEDHWQKSAPRKSFSVLKNQLFSMIPSFQDKHWNQHYLFEKGPSSERLPLMGENLKKEILVNVLFPVFEQEIERRSDDKEQAFFWEFYKSFSSEKSRKNTYLSQRLFSHAPGLQRPPKAIIEQGALQIHRDFCLHYEASCCGCPFVENYFKSTLERK